MSQEDFAVYRDGYRGRYFPRYRWWDRPRFYGRWGYVVGSPQVYLPQTVPDRSSYSDCVYAVGKCPNKFVDKYGKHFNSNRCTDQGVQAFSQSLPDVCLPIQENYKSISENPAGIF